MNILLISDVYFPRVNGVSTSIRTFTQQLQKMGHSVHLIAPDYGVTTEDEAWITRVAARSIYFDPEDKLMKYGEVLKLSRKLKAMQFDMLHIHTPFIAHYAGLKLAKTLNIPVIETYHTFFEDYLHHYLPWIPQFAARGLARMISKNQCNQVDAIVAPSQPMLDVLRSYGVNTLSEVIATGLLEHSFSPADGNAFKVKHGIALERPLLLYVGRVAHEKNIGFLLVMVKLLSEVMPEVLLVITGEGPAVPSLRASVKAHGIESNVQFIGYLNRETELNSCYKAADVFVFASKSETQGLVILEAMAQGTPVVAIAELGTASILIEGQGALIAPENESEFVQKVHSLLINPQRCQQLGEVAREYAQKKWSAATQAERMVKFYMVIASTHGQTKKPAILNIQRT
ncbi:MAG: glycosyl transferase family 1 [Proteobacteria bacterium ST_bin12]|nr:MAG: glycosyl transferase family 1 [Proteobacteria bacterium ST_bin12]